MESLPAELIREIGDQLPVHDLTRLTRVSRRINIVTQNALEVELRKRINRCTDRTTIKVSSERCWELRSTGDETPFRTMLEFTYMTGAYSKPNDINPCGVFVAPHPQRLSVLLPESIDNSLGNILERFNAINSLDVTIPHTYSWLEFFQFLSSIIRESNLQNLWIRLNANESLNGTNIGAMTSNSGMYITSPPEANLKLLCVFVDETEAKKNEHIPQTTLLLILGRHLGLVRNGIESMSLRWLPRRLNKTTKRSSSPDPMIQLLEWKDSWDFPNLKVLHFRHLEDPAIWEIWSPRTLQFVTNLYIKCHADPSHFSVQKVSSS